MPTPQSSFLIPTGTGRNPAPRPTWMGSPQAQNDSWDRQPELLADLAKQKIARQNRLLPQGAFQRVAYNPSSYPNAGPNYAPPSQANLDRARTSWDAGQDQMAEQDRRSRLPSQVRVDAGSAVNASLFPGNMNYQKWVDEQRNKLMRNYQTNNPMGSTFNAWNQATNPRPVAPAPRPTPYQGQDISALFAQFMQQFRPKG